MKIEAYEPMWNGERYEMEVRRGGVVITVSGEMDGATLVDEVHKMFSGLTLKEVADLDEIESLIHDAKYSIGNAESKIDEIRVKVNA